MKQMALDALNLVLRPGVTYADVRVIESRERELSTKNGRPGNVASAESLGLGIRVLADGCWGFAATDDLTQTGHRCRRRVWPSASRAPAPWPRSAT